MSIPVHHTYCIFYLHCVNGNAKKVDFVVKRYTVRKAKIRPYAVHRLKIKQYAVRKGGGVSNIVKFLSKV